MCVHIFEQASECLVSVRCFLHEVTWERSEMMCLAQTHRLRVQVDILYA